MTDKKPQQDPRIEKIRKMADRGMPNTEIGRALGITDERVRQLRKKYGLPSTRITTRKKREDQIAELLNKGLTQQQVEKQLRTISKIVSKVAHRIEAPALVRTPPLAWKILADLLNTTDSLAEIGERHNVGRQTVWHIQRRAEASGIRVKHRKTGRPAKP